MWRSGVNSGLGVLRTKLVGMYRIYIIAPYPSHMDVYTSRLVCTSTPSASLSSSLALLTASAAPISVLLECVLFR